MKLIQMVSKTKEDNNMIIHEINRLINFALQKGLIYEEDKIYSANMLIGLLNLDNFEA